MHRKRHESENCERVIRHHTVADDRAPERERNDLGIFGRISHIQRRRNQQQTNEVVANAMELTEIVGIFSMMILLGKESHVACRVGVGKNRAFG